MSKKHTEIKLEDAIEHCLTRQLYYSSKNKNSLDMVIFLNGLPVITAELKNQMSGQTGPILQTTFRA